MAILAPCLGSKVPKRSGQSGIIIDYLGIKSSSKLPIPASLLLHMRSPGKHAEAVGLDFGQPNGLPTTVKR